MQSLNPAERKDMVSQIASLDTSDITIDDLTASILDILTPKNDKTPASSSSFSVYA